MRRALSCFTLIVVATLLIVPAQAAMSRAPGSGAGTSSTPPNYGGGVAPCSGPDPSTCNTSGGSGGTGGSTPPYYGGSVDPYSLPAKCAAGFTPSGPAGKPQPPNGYTCSVTETCPAGTFLQPSSPGQQATTGYSCQILPMTPTCPSGFSGKSTAEGFSCVSPTFECTSVTKVVPSYQGGLAPGAQVTSFQVIYACAPRK